MKLKIIFALFFSQFLFSQIWVNSIDEAKKLALATNKLIMIDFNASWCKPCRMMESEFYYSNKYKETLNKFIAVSIDIDTNKNIASYYGVSSIPNIKIVDINGDVIHEALGFENGERSHNEFKDFPDAVGDLYNNLQFKDRKYPTDEELLNVATSYQILIQKTNGNAKKDFYGLSNSYLNKTIKKTQNNNFKEISELGKFFNSVLMDNGKKAIKSIDVSKISNENKSYAHYILAKANYQEGNKQDAEKHIVEIEKLNDEHWLSAAQTLRKKYN